MRITEFINECRRVQNAILPQEEANIVLHLRSKFHGRARKALHQQQFAIIEQLLNRLKNSFGIKRDISACYTEFGQLCMRNWEEVVDYINKAQTVCSNIIEAEKSLRGSLTNAEIYKTPDTRINEQSLRLFYSKLSSDLRTLIREQNS